MEEVQFGGYKAHEKLQISAKFHVSSSQNYKFQCHSPGGDIYIDVLIYSAPQLQECLIYLLTYLHCLRAYIAVSLQFTSLSDSKDIFKISYPVGSDKAIAISWWSTFYVFHLCYACCCPVCITDFGTYAWWNLC